MKRTALAGALAFALGVCLHAAPAEAADYLFVASNGSDGSADCNLHGPCQTFNRAVDVAPPGSYVYCLDPPIFSFALGISKSITIDCTRGLGQVNGISVSGAGINVKLRNLLVRGDASGPGIGFSGGNALFIENCTIFGWSNTFGYGIFFEPNAASQLYITDSLIEGNGNSSSGGAGLFIRPSGSGSARVIIDRTRVLSNISGIVVDGTNSSARTVVEMSDGIVGGNSLNGITVNNAGMLINRVMVEANLGNGILAGPGTLIHINGSTVATNLLAGLAYNGGQIFSYQNNQLNGNTTDNGPTGVLTLK